MPIKRQEFQIQGMYRDVSEHLFDPKFAYENQNIRITAEPNQDSSKTGDAFAMTNERGNIYKSIYGLDETGHNADVFGNMWGIPIGQALLNNQWVVFMIDKPQEITIDGQEKWTPDIPYKEYHINNLKVNNLDRIYKLWFNGDVLCGTLLYEGKLNFDYQNPIETLPYFENEKIQKVYWTDGLNQPRFINIVESEEKKAKWTDTSFDFVSTVELKETVQISEKDSGGMFPAGKIQYFFTYSNSFGVETNIFRATELFDLKFPKRGAAPDERTSQSFEIRLTNLDPNFQYVNIYSAIRTSLDTTPTCKRVAHLTITPKQVYIDTYIYEVSFIDTNLSGETIEPSELFYKGGEQICAYTFDQKDNTLFIGNYTIQRPTIKQTIKDALRAYALNIPMDSSSFKRSLKTSDSGNLRVGLAKNDDTAKYKNACKMAKKYFRKGNIYRLGIQFQYYTGKWSEVVWLGDYQCMDYSVYKQDTEMGVDWYESPLAHLKFDSNARALLQSLIDQGYRRIRPVIVYPNIKERKVLAQGIICNTIHSNRDFNRYYPDYLFRVIDNNLTDNNYKGYLSRPKFVDEQAMGEGEYAFPYLSSIPYIPFLLSYINSSSDILLFQDGRICSMYSPEFEFDDSYKCYNYTDVILRGIKGIQLTSAKSEIDIQTSSISKGDCGRYKWGEDAEFEAFHNYWRDTIYPDIWHWDDYNETSPDSTVRHGNEATWELFSKYKQAVIDDRYVPSGIMPKRILIPKSFRYASWYTHYVGGYIWHDTLRNIKTKQDELLQKEVPTVEATFMGNFWNYVYPVYMWQPSGSINYDTEANPSSVLKSNHTFNYHWLTSEASYNTTSTLEVKAAAIFNGATVKLDYPNVKEAIFYNGNVDTMFFIEDHRPTALRKLIKYDNDSISWKEIESIANKTGKSISIEDMNNGTAYGYDGIVELYYEDFTPWGGYWNNKNKISFDWLIDSMQNYKRSITTSVKYRSIPHLALAVGLTTLDTVDNRNHLNRTGVTYDTISALNNRLVCADLEQPVVTDTMFGGYTEDVLQANSFIPCGEIVDMCSKVYDEDNDVYKYVVRNNTEVIWKYGDTYRQTYSCLKTYPSTLQDENMVHEILDFKVETYFNLEGRYDKNIDSPNMGTLPSNYNLMNPVYNQEDNFMVYHGLNLEKNDVDTFKNTFTWSLTKYAGDETDKWTQVTLASTYDVDGTKGAITKIINYSDQLLVFQPNGVASILYNEREQLATGSGLPVELSNSGKVTGVRYMTALAGCSNKWSICKSEKAIYWIDTINKQICNFSGNGLTNMSDNLGFHSWINSMIQNDFIWNPLDFDSFVTYFDPYNESVMFFFKEKMLSFNEQVQAFDSFFSYGHIPYYMAFNNSAFTLSDKDSDGQDTYKVWEQHKGRYNEFYTKYEPYWTTVLVNSEPNLDKVFNNIDIRSDMWDMEDNLLEETYSHLEVWNEYQHNKSLLIRRVDIPKVHIPLKHSILKKKYRTWYINIPRDQKTPNSRYFNRDRMRNTWMYLKLSKEIVTPEDDEELINTIISYNKHIIHNFGVSYFV